MTTIDEMDEFFNFEDAAHDLQLDANDKDYSHLASGPYDIDLAFAEPQNDENSFACLQHFSAPEEEPSFCLNNAKADTAMMGPDDFTDFPRWIDGMYVASDPCNYCRRMRIHCKIIKEGLRKGSCTSCVALARSCSLTYDPTPGNEASWHKRWSQSSLNDNSHDAGEFDAADWSTKILQEQCEYCCKNGYQCKVIQEGPRIGSCTSCATQQRACSLDLHQDLMAGGVNPNNSRPPSRSALELPNHFSHSNSAPNLVALKSSDENINSDLGNSGPKVGARFSRESVRILKGWLSTHHRHPYPTEEEKESLRRQTGLNKTQITNWLANARRRGKVRAPRSTSPSMHNYANAMDIPRRATPALENMNPLERWQHSPPENEPASVTAIAKAVTSSTFSSGLDSPYTSYGHTDDGSNRSLCNVSSTSSLGTSHSSGGSFASAFSHKSRGSFGSFGSFGNRGRRRRRRQAPKPVKLPTSSQPARTFQCTFCTETFKTKHDWQRHEKSLHLSLERWICCPDGPSQYCADYGHNRCVFCALPNPPEGHGEVHNYSSCAERSLEERTFYRKDHLRQHLNLVHDAKFQGFSMDCWKVATPEIRSRCGFCGIIMDSWTIRVDHLAEHFKGGKSMADWKGDWGFEPQVLDIVENGMPPYLIHDERNSMNPFQPSKDSADDQKTFEDLVKIGLTEFIHDRVLRGSTPTDDDLLVEARKIIRTADQLNAAVPDPEASWFRDLIMLSGPQTEESKIQCPEAANMSWATKLELIANQAVHNSTDLTAISCAKQRALMNFVHNKRALGLTPTNSELQVEACRILDEIETTSNYKCKGAVSWFKYLVSASTEWLEEFRRRAGLPRSSDMAIETIRSTDDKSIDYSIHNTGRLEKELVDYVKVQMAAGIKPTDADLQRQARLIIYNNDDPWNQTAADNPGSLHVFKRQNGLAPPDDDSPDLPSLQEATEHAQMDHHSFATSRVHSTLSPRTLHWDLENSDINLLSTRIGNSALGTTRNMDQPLHTLIQNQPSTNTNPTQPLKYFLNDAHCYGRLVRELSRFVTTCMSPNNPNQHVPSDAELQHQARWVIYDDDDPWNQTAADNAEWLIRFKRDVGIAPPDSGPGLPSTETASMSWRVGMGGTGFSPPFLNPNAPPAPYTDDVDVTIDDHVYTIKATTADKFLKSMTMRYQPPAQVFCSRELENGLSEFVKSQLAVGVVPSDDTLRAKARDILGVEQTAADDLPVLEKFKALHGIPFPEPYGNCLPALDDAMLAEFDKEIQNMDLSGLDMTTALSGVDMQGSTKTVGEMEGVGMDQVKERVELFGNQVGERSYADLYRVQAATSSPLRRRASERMVEQSGFVLPPAESQIVTGIFPSGGNQS